MKEDRAPVLVAVITKLLVGNQRVDTAKADELYEIRRRVGYLPEGHRFPGYLTARQTLSIWEGRSLTLLEGILAGNPDAAIGRLHKEKDLSC